MRPALEAVLRAGRADLNARFAMARRRMPALDGAAFGAFVAEALGPLADAVAAERPDRVADVVHAAYDVALELCGQRLAGAGARDGRVGEAWAALVRGAAAPLIAQSPGRALAASANALASLAAMPGARPDDWATAMSGVAAARPELDTWLAAGQVLAWRAGMAHYRAGALDVADRLPPALALALVGAATGDDWSAVRARLRGDPWHVPGAAPAPPVRVVGRVGAFRGFGGLFPEPPTVRAAGVDRFLVESGGDRWVLFADACGATFHRASEADAQAAPARRVVQPPIELAERGSLTSTARAAATLAVTSTQTHSILLLAMPA
ncbi:MAG TPA: hypothetical protein VMZ28_27985 [Kofleriaceae bacterium]|nr:hypothetical protein [Kofleriaceae bacterium]